MTIESLRYVAAGVCVICCLAHASEYETLLRHAMEYERQNVVDRNRDEAVRRYRAAIAAAPNDPRNFFAEVRIGVLYLHGFDGRREQWDPEAARKVFERVQETYPQFNDRTEMLRVHEHLGSLYRHFGEHEKAAEVLWWAIERDPSRVRPADPFFGLKGLELQEPEHRRRLEIDAPEDSPEYQRLLQLWQEMRQEVRARSWIGPANRVRKGAMRVLARSTFQSGGIQGLLELENKRPEDPLFQSIIQQHIDRATEQLVREAGEPIPGKQRAEVVEAELAAVAAAESQLLRKDSAGTIKASTKRSTRPSESPGIASASLSGRESSDLRKSDRGSSGHVWLMALAAGATGVGVLAIWTFHWRRRRHVTRPN